jgi:hypothetical protein
MSSLYKGLALFRDVVSGQEINERGFAGAVGSYDSQGFLFDQFEIHVVDGDEISEPFRYPFGDQHGLGAHREPLMIEYLSKITSPPPVKGEGS